MTRPLRIEFPNALYYVASYGHRCQAVYEDEADREIFLDILAAAVQRFHWRCYAYCQATSKYELLVATPQPNLSAGMRYINGVYTQTTNRRHRRDGHVFKGRYKAILVQPDRYLLDMAVQIVLTPVRDAMVGFPGAWRWCSYRATCGDEFSPEWLAVDRLLGHLSNDAAEARKQYYLCVLNGIREKKPPCKVRQQLYIGEDDFIRRVQGYVKNPADPNVSHTQKRPPVPSLDEFAKLALTRNDAIAKAYRTGAYSYAAIARYFAMHPSTVCRVLRKGAPPVFRVPVSIEQARDAGGRADHRSL